ncbi:phosphate-starvation-inducible PsiE family protein [Oceanimonas sp. NS1]|uniref:Protein PsiE n=1 Tax=Oceanimonas doudoroffii TaxID=84158 RepID=A0A233RH14_9GAMM|nr:MULTISPECIES: phosphate-starvation-inducible PsiE family protein [Oceanimonas]MCT7656557.1 phosphate-starvation-inducible PsiE family protein [Oceanimonas sp. NS1]NHI00730.1 Protein PsiE [Oceanimonas sp. MB9]OXY82686.1 phosphate-starvation-inducible E [Oceanimonas doudoroffii]
MSNNRMLGSRALDALQHVGLIIVAIATVVAVGIEVNTMWRARTVTLADLLLMFIYLEVLAMVAIYLRSGKLPIRIPLYIAIVALARYLILDMKGMDNWRLITVAGAALVLALAILAIRFGHVKYPYDKDEGGH